jgi:hypothetical protein
MNSTDNAAPEESGGARKTSSIAASIPSEVGSDKSGFDLIERLHLQGIVGPAAEFATIGSGWQYRDGQRLYSLASDSGGCSGTLEIFCNGGYAVATGDWRVNLCREDVARVAARGEAALERSILLDLFQFSKAIQFALIDAWVVDVPEDPEMPPTPTANPEPAADTDIIVRGLNGRARVSVIRRAKKLGGRVFRRREI